jgi:hypothetical protein
MYNSVCGTAHVRKKKKKSDHTHTHRGHTQTSQTAENPPEAGNTTTRKRPRKQG